MCLSIVFYYKKKIPSEKKLQISSTIRLSWRFNVGLVIFATLERSSLGRQASCFWSSKCEYLTIFLLWVLRYFNACREALYLPQCLWIHFIFIHLILQKVCCVLSFFLFFLISKFEYLPIFLPWLLPFSEAFVLQLCNHCTNLHQIKFFVSVFGRRGAKAYSLACLADYCSGPEHVHLRTLFRECVFSERGVPVMSSFSLAV